MNTSPYWRWRLSRSSTPQPLAAGMRELLCTATPVITLPAIEIVLPTLCTEQS